MFEVLSSYIPFAHSTCNNFKAYSSRIFNILVINAFTPIFNKRQATLTSLNLQKIFHFFLLILYLTLNLVKFIQTQLFKSTKFSSLS